MGIIMAQARTRGTTKYSTGLVRKTFRASTQRIGTYLQVVLDQTGNERLLHVENDRVELVPAKKGGDGTKAMNTIAQQLPEGKWGRVHTEDNQTIVTLIWSMKGLWEGE